MVLAAWLVHLGVVYLAILSLAGLALAFVLMFSLFQQQFLHSKLLFRSASLFMLLSMVLIILGKL